jgi:hypothetical protein
VYENTLEFDMCTLGVEHFTCGSLHVIIVGFLVRALTLIVLLASLTSHIYRGKRESLCDQVERTSELLSWIFVCT